MSGCRADWSCFTAITFSLHNFTTVTVLCWTSLRGKLNETFWDAKICYFPALNLCYMWLSTAPCSTFFGLLLFCLSSISANNASDRKATGSSNYSRQVDNPTSTPDVKHAFCFSRHVQHQGTFMGENILPDIMKLECFIASAWCTT